MLRFETTDTHLQLCEVIAFLLNEIVQYYVLTYFCLILHVCVCAEKSCEFRFDVINLFEDYTQCNKCVTTLKRIGGKIFSSAK